MFLNFDEQSRRQSNILFTKVDTNSENNSTKTAYCHLSLKKIKTVVLYKFKIA